PDLEAAGVREERAVPAHEAVEPAERPDQLVPRAEEQVVGVREHELSARRAEVVRRQTLDGAARADGHEDRCLDHAVGGREAPACPSTGRTRPSAWAALSSARVVVGPTARTRRPSTRARFTASATAGGIDTRSGGSRWPSTVAALMGRKVPGPTCSVSSWISSPRARTRSSTARVKCRPAVGAATDPGGPAYTVW